MLYLLTCQQLICDIFLNGHFVSLNEFPCAHFLRLASTRDSVMEIQLARFRASQSASQHKMVQANACKIMVKGVQNHQTHQRAPTHTYRTATATTMSIISEWQNIYCVNYSITHHNSNQFNHSDDAKLRSLATVCVRVFILTNE